MDVYPENTTPFAPESEEIQVSSPDPQNYYPGFDDNHQIAFENQMMENAVNSNGKDLYPDINSDGYDATLAEQAKNNILNINSSLNESETPGEERNDVVRATLVQRNQELKALLENSQDTLLSLIPVNQREKFSQSNFKNRFVEVPKQAKPDPSQSALMLAQKNIEIRQIGDKEYVVHKVDPATDSLFKLTYNYKVSKNDIWEANKFQGDNIAVFRELLIPYHGQEIMGIVPDEAKKQEMMRSGQVVQLAAFIKRTEIKKEESQNANGRLSNSYLPSQNFQAEAKYYLNDTDWDYQKAVKLFEQDIEEEKKMAQQKPQKAKNQKKKECVIF